MIFLAGPFWERKRERCFRDMEKESGKRKSKQKRALFEPARELQCLRKGETLERRTLLRRQERRNLAESNPRPPSIKQ